MALGKGVNWKGKYFIIPQAASYVDPSGLQRVDLGSSGKLCLMGEMVGLLPSGAVKKITNPSLGKSLVHTSCDEMRRAIEAVFDPTCGATPGASEVYLLPVNPCEPGTITFSDLLLVTTYIYGAIANKAKMKIETGSTSGKKISIAYGDETETFDNIIRESFSIQYTGEGTAATMTIDVAADSLVTTCTGASDDDLALTLSSYDSIQELVDAIELTGVYEVEVLTDSPDDELPTQLDDVSAIDILTSTQTLESTLQAMIDKLNSQSGYFAAERAGTASGPPANQDWTCASGAIDGDTANSDWQSAFDLLKTMDMDIIVPITSDASIHSMLKSHLTYMSGPSGKSERRGFVGGDLQSWASETTRTNSVNALLAAVKALNSDRVTHVGLGSYLYNDDGESVLYPAYLTACMYAGIAAGGGPVLPLTRKYLNTAGLEVELRTGEIEDLIEGGVAVPIPDVVQNAGYVISRQVTTWKQDTNDYRIEFSVGRGADYIAREVRKRHELIIGQPGTLGMDETIVNITNAVLRRAKEEEYIRDFDPNKTQLRVDGTIRYIDYSAQPILPINFIFSTYHLQPTVMTISLGSDS